MISHRYFHILMILIYQRYCEDSTESFISATFARTGNAHWDLLSFIQLFIVIDVISKIYIMRKIQNNIDIVYYYYHFDQCIMVTDIEIGRIYACKYNYCLILKLFKFEYMN